MKVEKIKKVSNKYKIIFENKEVITTYDDVIINNNILYKNNINEEIIHKIISETNYYEMYNKVLKYINTKLRSEYEIVKYMQKLEIDEKNQNKILEKLKKINLINDESFTKAYIHDKLNLSNDGPLKIRKELINHQINIELIEQELSKIDNKYVLCKLEKLILKKINGNTKYSNNMLKQKLLNYFINMGYEKNDILFLIDSNKKKNDEVIKKEYVKLYNKYHRKYNDDDLNNMIKKKLYLKGFGYDEINMVISNQKR